MKPICCVAESTPSAAVELARHATILRRSRSGHAGRPAARAGDARVERSALVVSAARAARPARATRHAAGVGLAERGGVVAEVVVGGGVAGRSELKRRHAMILDIGDLEVFSAAKKIVSEAEMIMSG